MEMQRVMDEWFHWFCKTSMVVGMPVLVLGVIIGAQKLYYTLACHSANLHCARAFGLPAKPVAVDYTIADDDPIMKKLRD